MSDANELRFLEGEAALRERIRLLTGRRPSATQAAYTAACIMHGRLYWESANSGPMETKPLLLYYGAASFAKALIMAKTCCQIGNMANAHSVSCSSGVGDTVGTYKVRTNGSGDRPVDDQLIPAIEALLARSVTAIPKFVADVLLQR